MNDTELDRLLDTWKAPDAPPSMRTGLRAQFASRPRRNWFVRLRWPLAFAAAAGALVGASLVQDGTLGSDAGPWDPGTQVRRTRMVHPFLARFGWSGKRGLSTGWQRVGGTLVGSVYLLDQTTRMHYGYTWHAEPLGGGTYRFTVLPLDPSVLREAGPIAAPARPAAPLIVGPGSTFEVDLYNSGSERVYDRYDLSSAALPLPRPQDPDRITLTRPELSINGTLAMDSGGVAEAGGNRVTVRVRGRGEYTLVLEPHGDTRFVKAGGARGNAIEFQVGADRFRVECSAPVSGGLDRDVFVYVKNGAPPNSSGFGGGGGPGPVLNEPGRN